MKTLKFNLTKTDIAKATKLAKKYEQEQESKVGTPNWCTICIIAVVIRKKIPNAWVSFSNFTKGPAYLNLGYVSLPQDVKDIIRLWDSKQGRDQVVPMSFTLEVPDDF